MEYNLPNIQRPCVRGRQRSHHPLRWQGLLDLVDEMEDKRFGCFTSALAKSTYMREGGRSCVVLYEWREFVKHILIEHYGGAMPKATTKLVNTDTLQSDDWFVLESVLDGGAPLSLQAPTVQVVLSGI
ncbi:uncharacterized protein ARMOST_18965 [Armillaria ostoyae]|uniref:Uncharacterized protein n=1 Tax=Armillaria ostoyae TaxID=47428 RepID=A0A284S3D1_ARMOS|nr:uncharacterized protein ARMOST_18965 [Armillaria ostoyae]